MPALRHAFPFTLIDPARHPVPDPADPWVTLRARHPVAWCEGENGQGFWVIARYADIAAVYRDTGRLSSQQGNVLATIMAGGDSAGGRMLVVTDPPRHTDMRRVLQGAFSPRAMARILDALTSATRDTLGALVCRGGGDFAREVAAVIPLLTMCELFDVPAAERPRMLDLTMAAMGTEREARAGGQAAAQREILQYYAHLLALRRTDPGPDIVSLMAAEQPDGTTLTDAEILLNCYNIIIGGNETTRFSASGGVLALIEHPEQWQRLQEDESLLDSAVEEVLRWTTPATHVARTATTDIVLQGVEIKAGDIVTLWNTSANRDEQVFADPYTFDIGRTPNRHLALGHGPHFCLGGPLARTELRLLLSEMRRQVPELKLDGPLEWIGSSVLAGLSRLPLAVTSRPTSTTG
ncbi:cytochrome P450 [Micromonospora profundi]|uniref:cytochrome P450 n=1 Tax=Micromonospora profundi TaxID=1420889 RepID=UPI0033ADAEAF